MKHDTWMSIAEIIAEKESKCIAHKVGCVIVKDNRIVSTGYNGTPSKQPNCCDVNSHLVHDGQLQQWTSETAAAEHHKWSQQNELHAEMNAVIYSRPEDLKGSTLYCTLQPCNACSAVLAGSGVIRIIYKNKYHRSTECAPVLKNIEVIHFKDL